MTSHKNENIAPISIQNELWHVDSPELNAAHLAREEINNQNPGQLLDDLSKKVETSEGGIKYAILKGDKPDEYSDTNALVMFNPFANTATKNMLLRAEYIRRVAAHSDVRDDEGKLKPVIMLASPGVGGSKLTLTEQDRQEIGSGNLGPAAEQLLRAVTERDFGRVALFGFSQGAEMAMSGARDANSLNLDLDGIAVGDPAGVEDRSKIVLGKDFMKATDLKPSMQRTAMAAQKKALSPVGMPGFIASTAYPVNQLLYKGMSKNSFEANARAILEGDAYSKFVVGYGMDSAITKPSAIEPALRQLHQEHEHADFISIKVGGADHTWGDQLPLLAKLYMRAVS